MASTPPPTRAASRGIAAASLLLMVISGTLPSAASYRQDYHDDNYLVGYLTYKEGKTGISWNAEAPSDPTGPPISPTDGVDTVVGANLEVATGSDNGLKKKFEFTSEPFPATMWLNSSRMIELDLFLNMGNCEYTNSGVNLFYTKPVDVELWVGDVFVAGAVDQASWSEYGALGTMSWKRFRLQPETERLAEGSQVRLVVILRDQCSLEFGLAKPSRSVVRFAYYSAFDQLFRIPPDKVAGSGPSPAPQGATAPLLAPVVGLLALATRRPSRRASTAALAALLLAGAGCIGSSGQGTKSGSDDPAATSGRVDVTIEPGSGGPNGGNGSMVGTIHDDKEIPVAGAHVSLLGTTNFTGTDALGRFQISSLRAGEYTIRVDKGGFRSAEAQVAVKAGAISRLTIVLFPLEAKTDNFRPHRHDLWPGPTKPVPLLGGGDVVLGGPCFQSGPLLPGFGIGAGSCADGAYTSGGGPVPNRVASVPFVLDRGEVILPGTYSIDVKVSWSPTDGTMDRVGVAFSDNHDPDGGKAPERNSTLMYPKRPGETTHIQTNWEMTDIGHQRFTTWLFWLYWPPQTTSSSGALAPVVGFDMPPSKFHVDMTIVRGVVPLEPAHRDFWGPNTTYVSMAERSCTLVGTHTGARGCALRPERLVPPETTWIEVLVNQTADSGVDLALAYEASVYDAEKPIAAKVPTGAARVHWTKIEDIEADSMYNRVSTWTILVKDTDDTVQLDEANLEVTLISHRDAFPG